MVKHIGWQPESISIFRHIRLSQFLCRVNSHARKMAHAQVSGFTQPSTPPFMDVISEHGHTDTGISFDTAIVLSYIRGYEETQAFNC
jgi:hypothetical protein